MNVNHIIPQDVLCYMASPYSRFLDGITKAFEEASRIAAILLKAGIKVFSPIAHGHPISVHGNIDPHDHNIWLPFDEHMMRACQALIVAEMPGWQESKGVAHEIAFFEERGRPIFHVDVEGVVIRVQMETGGTGWKGPQS